MFLFHFFCGVYKVRIIMTLTLFLFSYARAVEIDFYKNKNGKGRKHMNNDFLLSIYFFSFHEAIEN